MGSRLKPETTMLEAIEIMAEGNAGAASVLTQMFELEGLACIEEFKHLDAADIYGEDIVIAYKDVCKEKIATLIKLLPEHDVLRASVAGAKRLTS